MVGKFIKVCMKFCAPLGLLVYLPSDDTPWRSVGMFLLTFVGTLEFSTVQSHKIHLKTLLHLMLFRNNFHAINYGLGALLSWSHFNVAESYNSGFPLYSCISLNHNLGDVCAKKQMAQ